MCGGTRGRQEYPDYYVPDSRVRAFTRRCVMNPTRREAGGLFLPSWVLVSTAGWIIAVLSGVGIGFLVANVAGEFLIYVLFTSALGVVVGLSHWLILRRCITLSTRWIMASAVGLALAGAGICLFFSSGFKTWGCGSIMALGGIVSGALQWFILRQKVTAAGWWVLASGIDWGLAMVIGLATDEFFALRDHSV
jgi:hypothetical protein